MGLNHLPDEAWFAASIAENRLLVVIQSDFWAAAKKSVAAEDKGSSCFLQMLSANRCFSVTKRAKAGSTSEARLVAVSFGVSSVAAKELKSNGGSPQHIKQVSQVATAFKL